jgi:hypothetical protein
MAKRLSKTQKIRNYMKDHPEAKAKVIAEAIGTKINYVYTIMHNERKKLKASATPDSLVKVQGVTMGKDDKTNLTDEQMSRLVFNATKPKIRMQRSIDDVNHPPHYKIGGIETIDVIEAKLTPEEFRGYLKGNVVKYLTRIGYKDDAGKDVDKMVWYALKLQPLYA